MLLSTTHSHKEVSEVLKFWTPAAMEPETHRPQQTAQYERGKDPYLVFKNVPPSINVEILISLCSAYGKVLRARQHDQFNMYFVNFATLSDLWSVVEGLKVNAFGMTIELGKMVLSRQNPAVENQRDSERIAQKTPLFHDGLQNSKDKIHNYVS